MAKVDHCILAAVRCMEYRLLLTGLRLVQKRLQLIDIGDRREAIELNRIRACSICNDVRAEAGFKGERIIARSADRYRERLVAAMLEPACSASATVTS